MTRTDKISLVLATGFYVGRIPFAPGTFGTLVGLVPVFFLSLVAPSIALLIIAAASAAAVWIAHRAEAVMGEKDPGSIVIDEIVGVMIALWGFAFDPVMVVSGFVLFRFFDIVKPFPIRRLEKVLPGGAGIVADDVAAGIIANIVLRFGFWVLGFGFEV